MDANAGKLHYLLFCVSGGVMNINNRLTKAIYESQPKWAEPLTQGRDTLPENTWKAAAKPDRIHPGARRYLAELGLK